MAMSSDAKGALIQGAIGMGSGLMQGIGQGNIASQDRKVNQQQMLMNLLLQGSQINPYKQLQYGQQAAMQGEILPHATNAGFSFDPSTGMGNYTGGARIPEGGFSAQTQQMFSPESQQSAYGQTMSPINEMSQRLAGASGMATAPQGYKYSDTGELQKKTSVMQKIGKVAGVVAPIAAMAIPGIGPILGAALMAGGGAASGAATGGLKGALLGGAAGAIPGVGGAALSKFAPGVTSALGNVGTHAALGAASGGLTGGMGGALSGGAMGALSAALARGNPAQGTPVMNGNPQMPTAGGPGTMMHTGMLGPQSPLLQAQFTGGVKAMGRTPSPWMR